MKSSGITLTLFTSLQELQSTKDGGSILLARNTKTKVNEYQISATLDACELLEGGEVRVNLTLVKKSVDDIGSAVGAAMGAELEKVLTKLMAAEG